MVMLYWTQVCLCETNDLCSGIAGYFVYVKQWSVFWHCRLLCLCEAMICVLVLQVTLFMWSNDLCSGIADYFVYVKPMICVLVLHVTLFMWSNNLCSGIAGYFVYVKPMLCVLALQITLFIWNQWSVFWYCRLHSGYSTSGYSWCQLYHCWSTKS